jgi:hypothetical protein
MKIISLKTGFLGCFGLVWSALLLASGVAVAAPLTVRVQPTPGGPQIHVNGQPIPPRFFWGADHGGSPWTPGPEWSSHSFEFTPDVDVAEGGTLHLRFAHRPGELWLADVRIQAVEGGADAFPVGSLASREAFAAHWKSWPEGPANSVARLTCTNGALQLQFVAPAGGQWPDFHLYSRAPLKLARDRAYRCSFRARSATGQTVTPALYRVAHGSWQYVGGPPGPFLSQVALARDAGVRLISFEAPVCWSAPDEPQDWSALDSLCRRIMAVHPGVLLVPRFAANAPGWWLQQHPQARMVYDGSSNGTVVCVSDRTYRADVCAHLEKLSRHLLAAFPDHFAGLHPCGQNTGEWFYHNSWLRPLSGYDPATIAAFRAWLKQKGDPAAAQALPPTAEERRAHPYGLLRDPARERRLVEFARFQQQEMADLVLAMAAACRRGTEGRKLVLFFYGYGFEFPPLSNGAPTSGHYALGSLLAGRDIDILCSPVSYTDREWLGTAPCMTAAESVARAGILWLNEDDSRTHMDPRSEAHTQEGGLVNQQQSRQVMLRNTAQAALRGFGTWWMDLPGRGWFNDAALWQELVRLRPVDQALLQRARPFTPEIAAILDEDSMCHLTGGSAAAVRPLIYEGRAALGRSGAPYGQYLLADALAGRVPARLQFYLSAWALTPEQRRALAARRAPGITRVWCWAPGYLHPDRQDLAGIREVTGFTARPVTLPTAEVTPTPAGQAQGLTRPWGPKTALQPLFSVAAPGAEVLATYTDGSPAVAVRRDPSGTEVFLGVPQLTPELVHALAKAAGVHLFTPPGPALWASDGYLSVQAQQTGPLLLDTGRAQPIKDALDGAELGQGPKVSLPLIAGETRVLRY